MSKSLQKYFCLTFFTLSLFLSSCGTKKNLSYSSEKASAAASALANVKSKTLFLMINDWVGVKYKNGGLDKNGIDCSGFAYLIQKQIYGKTLPRKSADQALNINQKNINNLKEGDLVFFSFDKQNIDHVGIYLNNGYFVHASTSRGVIVDDINLPAFQKALVKSGSLK